VWLFFGGGGGPFAATTTISIATDVSLLVDTTNGH